MRMCDSDSASRPTLPIQIATDLLIIQLAFWTVSPHCLGKDMGLDSRQLPTCSLFVFSSFYLSIKNQMLGLGVLAPPLHYLTRVNCFIPRRTQALPMICTSVSIHKAAEWVVCRRFTKNVTITTKIHNCRRKLWTPAKQSRNFTQLCWAHSDACHWPAHLCPQGVISRLETGI